MRKPTITRYASSPRKCVAALSLGALRSAITRQPAAMAEVGSKRPRRYRVPGAPHLKKPTDGRLESPKLQVPGTCGLKRCTDVGEVILYPCGRLLRFEASYVEHQQFRHGRILKCVFR
jgi:hypothetical protein